MQNMHPLRLQYSVFSDKNPIAAQLSTLADQVKENRATVGIDNPFFRLQEITSDYIVTYLNLWRDARDAWAEQAFLWIYGSPFVEAATGVDETVERQRRAPRSLLHDDLLRARIAELKSRIDAGGIREALARSLLYVGMPRGGVDERGFEMIRRIRDTHEESALPLSEFKKLLREQFYMLLLDEKAAAAAIPTMLAREPTLRSEALNHLKQVLSAAGEVTGEVKTRLDEVIRLFGSVEETGLSPPPAVVTPMTKAAQAKAS
jgi:hypothetical protein